MAINSSASMTVRLARQLYHRGKQQETAAKKSRGRSPLKDQIFDCELTELHRIEAQKSCRRQRENDNDTRCQNSRHGSSPHCFERRGFTSITINVANDEQRHHARQCCAQGEVQATLRRPLGE